MIQPLNEFVSQTVVSQKQMQIFIMSFGHYFQNVMPKYTECLRKNTHSQVDEYVTHRCNKPLCLTQPEHNLA